jgi:hypothetical protein
MLNLAHTETMSLCAMKSGIHDVDSNIFELLYIPNCQTILTEIIVGVGALPIIKKTIYQQVLKLGANEASAQGLQNAI